jgi:hypothetical protein
MKRHIIVIIVANALIVLGVVLGVILGLTVGWQTGIITGLIIAAVGFLVGLIFGGANMLRIIRNPDKILDS